MNHLSNIPTELRTPPLWVEYYLSRDEKKPNKKPRKHPVFKYATAEDRAANFKSLDYLINNRAEPRAGGGYQRWVDKTECLVYVDLDHVRNPETGEVKPEATAIIEKLNSYTEVSSGTDGFHIVCRGTLPEDFKVEGYWIEIYSGHTRNKLIAMTGDTLGLSVTIGNRQQELEELLAQAKSNTGHVASVSKAELAVVDEPELAEEEKLPAFPSLPGALGQLVDGITHDLPYDHKAMAALTYIGIGLAKRISMLPDYWLQPRFYVCMVGPAGSAKSAAEFEVRRALCEGDTPVLSDLAVELSIDSGPALVQALEEAPNHRLILAPDELADQFEKARAGATGKNSLFGELLRLFESNETANRTKKKGGEGGKIEIRDGLFALIGGTTTQRFPEMFVGTGSNASGLQSRFVLSYSEQNTPRWKSPNDMQAIASACSSLSSVIAAAPKQLVVSDAAREAFMAWRKDDASNTDVMRRLLDQAKRFAMIVAACQNAENINEETMALALQFADYQLALRTRLFPPDASSSEQVFENLILAFLEKHGSGSEAVIQNRIGPERRRGGFISFNRAWGALFRCGKLVMVGPNRSGQPVYALRANLQGLPEQPCNLAAR